MTSTRSFNASHMLNVCDNDFYTAIADFLLHEKSVSARSWQQLCELMQSRYNINDIEVSDLQTLFKSYSNLQNQKIIAESFKRHLELKPLGESKSDNAEECKHQYIAI